MFVIAHLSDPHLGPIPEARISELLGKRFFGMMNWIGARRRNFGQATLAPLMADLLAQQPDHICVTGDLVNVSLPAEFDTGATFLGYILATMSIQGLFKFYAIISFAVPFLILGLPIFDTAFAFIRRIAHGQTAQRGTPCVHGFLRLAIGAAQA